MKKYALIPVLTIATLVFTSWGSVGHHAVAAIAENHLTPQAKAAVEEILGNETLADVSTWADEVRNTPEYKQTGSWHYINAPQGLSYNEFSNTIRGQTVENVYSAIAHCEHMLTDTRTTHIQKVEALKFLVHFVGDAHQPMHVSRAEDKGGNTVQVQFDGRGTNLHSVWDSKLIDHSGLTYVQMAKEFDTASQEEIKKWQHDDVMRWLYESYQISTRLYGEVDSNNKLDEAYYKEHLPIVEQRIEMAGIRLAGVLNKCFEGKTVFAAKAIGDTVTYKVAKTYIEVNAKDVANHVGDYVTVTGVVASTRLISSNNMTLLNIGATNPNQDFTIMIKGENRNKFGQPEVDLQGKKVKVKGMVVDYKGKPEIEVTDPKQLTY